MAKVLVTGGSGFIGSHLMMRLLRDGHDVTNLDRKPPILAEHHPFWRNCDIVSKEQISQHINEIRPELVYHLAAHAEISSTNLRDYDSITVGSSNLFAALAAVGSVHRLVNTSTQLVVGPGHYPQSDTYYQPYTMYGHAKMVAEQELRKSTPPYEWLHVRPTNIWGPYHPHFAHGIWRYLAKRQYLHPNAANPIVRCYGYVTNVIDQYTSLMSAATEKVQGKVFYLADGAIDSAIWLDQFSLALTSKKTRRIPLKLLNVLGWGGDGMKALGLPAPLDSGRVMRMSTNYLVPLEPTWKVTGTPSVTLADAVIETCNWLHELSPQTFRKAAIGQPDLPRPSSKIVDPDLC